MKLTRGQFNSLRSALSSGPCANDNWLMQEYGVNNAMISPFRRIVDALAGMDWRAVTFSDFNAALAGKRVCLTYANPSDVSALEAAFAAAKKGK